MARETYTEKVIRILKKKACNLEGGRDYYAENYEYTRAEKAHKHLQIINRKLTQALELYKAPKVQLQCNFCGKFESEVEKLITSANYYICNECIEIAYEMIHEHNE